MDQKNGYQYDVFISYPHGEGDEEVSDWVQGVFYKYFKHCLTNSILGRKVEVHLDTEAIQPGAKWDNLLGDALARTKVLVPIFSINYFGSMYCRAEFAVFLHREKELGYWERGKQGSLIVPVHLWGIEDTFPEIAKKYQYLQCKKYSHVREDSPLYGEFKSYLEPKILTLAETVNAAPEWNPAWCEKEWLDDPINAAEASRVLWPPKEVPYSLRSMAWDGGLHG